MVNPTMIAPPPPPASPGSLPWTALTGVCNAVESWPGTRGPCIVCPCAHGHKEFWDVYVLHQRRQYCTSLTGFTVPELLPLY